MVCKTEKLIQFADDIYIVCCGKESSLSSLHGKVKPVLQKTEEYPEVNKLNLTNKFELIIFSRKVSDFGSTFYKNKNVADTLISKWTGILISKSC